MKIGASTNRGGGPEAVGARGHPAPASSWRAPRSSVGTGKRALRPAPPAYSPPDAKGRCAQSPEGLTQA
eukprot:CAMPEP_0116916028 /NCGR_PEP_ID=MMETSP0467-20121206/18282_1 /TAXON_ID=283647 /ORGANISM="Mesodinium pulex, Strain SPMC105" /LENGTH=68 /DNA_ID=CAMNT_0004592809 /DNA_START=43 /DNA_END=250 /DNA_ORIENTATION=+